MAKTIEEMAVAYGHKHMGCCDIEDFEAGANAVLEEIEFLYQHCRDYQLYHLLGLKIKQLKGE